MFCTTPWTSKTDGSQFWVWLEMEKQTPALGGLGLSCISHLLSVFFILLFIYFGRALALQHVASFWSRLSWNLKSWALSKCQAGLFEGCGSTEVLFSAQGGICLQKLFGFASLTSIFVLVVLLLLLLHPVPCSVVLSLKGCHTWVIFVPAFFCHF